MRVATAVTAVLLSTIIIAMVAAPQRSVPATPARPEPSESMVGNILKYDATSKTLTVGTSKGEERFVLTPGIHVRQGLKTLALNDLASRVGRSVKVRFIQSGQRRTVQTIAVASGLAGPAAPAAAKR